MQKRTLLAGLVGAALLGACGSGDNNPDRHLVQEVSGGVNPYLWRASLDTLEDLPLASQPDPIGEPLIVPGYS